MGENKVLKKQKRCIFTRLTGFFLTRHRVNRGAHHIYRGMINAGMCDACTMMKKSRHLELATLIMVVIYVAGSVDIQKLVLSRRITYKESLSTLESVWTMHIRRKRVKTTSNKRVKMIAMLIL